MVDDGYFQGNRQAYDEIITVEEVSKEEDRVDWAYIMSEEYK